MFTFHSLRRGSSQCDVYEFPMVPNFKCNLIQLQRLGRVSSRFNRLERVLFLVSTFFFCFLFSFWGSISYPSKGYRGRSTGRKWHNFVDRLRSLVTESTECVGRFHGNASVVVVVVECLSVWRGGLSTFARVRTTTSTTITTATTKENWRRFSIRKFGSQCRPRLISK